MGEQSSNHSALFYCADEKSLPANKLVSSIKKHFSSLSLQTNSRAIIVVYFIVRTHKAVHEFMCFFNNETCSLAITADESSSNHSGLFNCADAYSLPANYFLSSIGSVLTIKFSTAPCINLWSTHRCSALNSLCTE